LPENQNKKADIEFIMVLMAKISAIIIQFEKKQNLQVNTF